jgi:hypothetical protein
VEIIFAQILFTLRLNSRLPNSPPLQTKGLKTKIKNNTSIKTQQDFVKKHSKFYLGQITL